MTDELTVVKETVQAAVDVAVDVERERLLALVKAVFDGAHYSVMCACGSCNEVRQTISSEDLKFIDDISETFMVSPVKVKKLRPIEAYPTQTPNELAAELKISPKTLRQWLRDKFPEDAPKNTGKKEWELTRQMIAEAHLRWAMD
jgi:hypothetical protein